MPSTSLLARLRFQQRRLLATADAFKTFVAAPHPGRVDDLAALRWSFTREMLMHFAALETEVLQPLSEDLRVDAANRAVRSSRDLANVYGHFQRHAARWHGLPSPDHWHEYREAIALLMRLIAVRIAAQERDIYPMLPVQPGGVRGVLPMAPVNYMTELWNVRRLIYADDHDAVAVR